MGLGDIFGDILEGVGSVLGNPAISPVLIEVGRQIYAHNNPPATRSLPPTQVPSLSQAAQNMGMMSYAAQPAQQAGIGTQLVDLAQQYFGVGSGTMAGSAIDYLQGQTNGGGAVAGTLPATFTQTAQAMHTPLVTPAKSTIRMASEVQVVNPVTGKLVTYKNMGRPVLYSGDLTACKRVRKVAARARRASGKR